MQVRELATLDGDGNVDIALPINSYDYHPEAVLQVRVSGTITVQVLGSLDGQAYVEMIPASPSSTLTPIALVPFLRFSASGTSGGGTATVKIMLGKVPRE